MEDPIASYNTKVHERSKKVGAHRVTCVSRRFPQSGRYEKISRFGDLEEASITSFYSSTRAYRLATFIFRYRPLGGLLCNCHFRLFYFDLDVLQANDIAPLAPRAAQAEQSNKRKLSEDDVIEIYSSDEDEIDQHVKELKAGVDVLPKHMTKLSAL